MYLNHTLTFKDILSRTYPVVLDLGSNYGHTSRLLLKEPNFGLKTLFQMELSEKMLLRDLDENKELAKKSGINLFPIVGDEEFLPFPPESLDLVISNLNIHWVNDLPALFSQVRKALKPDGLFLGSIFGEGTLPELRTSLSLAQQEREGGLSPHVSPFAGFSDIGSLLSSSDFTLPTIDKLTVPIRYSDPFVVLKDLRGMAENNSALKRRSQIPLRTLMSAASIYQDMFPHPQGGVTATFQIINFIGWTPHESQPKPKKRGSATVSLKSLGSQHSSSSL